MCGDASPPIPRHDKLGISAGSAYHLNFCIVEPSPPYGGGFESSAETKNPADPKRGRRAFGSASWRTLEPLFSGKLNIFTSQI